MDCGGLMGTLSDTYVKAVWAWAPAAANFTIAMSLSQEYTDGYQPTVRVTWQISGGVMRWNAPHPSTDIAILLASVLLLYEKQQRIH